MGNSCVTGGCSRSNKGGTIKWRIDSFSSLLDKGEGWTISREFEISGLNWFLRLNPRDKKNGDKNEYVSLTLEIESVRPNTVVEATFKFLIYNQLNGKHHEQHPVSHDFHRASESSGVSCMVPLDALKEKSSGFLLNNSCVFGVEFIKVAAAKVSDPTEVLFVQKNINTCSDPQVYVWNIEDYYTLKSPSYSPEFELFGHKWFIIIHPPGSDKNGNYLSLFLSMKVPDTLHKNSANLVEFSISIKGQETGKHRKLSARCEFSKNMVGYGWGWDKFISLEDFEDSSKGYLVKSKCCIEAQVAVIGTSKME